MKVNDLFLIFISTVSNTRLLERSVNVLSFNRRHLKIKLHLDTNLFSVSLEWLKSEAYNIRPGSHFGHFFFRSSLISKLGVKQVSFFRREQLKEAK